MTIWYRVFASNDAHPEPAALLEHLHGTGLEVSGHFRGDDQGWFRADLSLPDEGGSVEAECYLATEEGVRQELLTWAAWLETTAPGPVQDRLMLHLIGTRRVYTLHTGEDGADAEATRALCAALARFLARTTEGVYQADGEGFRDAEGALLVAEG
ncbi:MAG: hypothetical protein IT429_11045 [Gemmataceae bacterium]|nr:hypothetical protein [Gemmataceae bacterium]